MMIYDSISKKIALPVAGMMLAISGIVFCMAWPQFAFAEGDQGSNEWIVSFDGDSMDSTFEDGRFDDTIAGMQPGDTVTFNVDLDNSAPESTDWYMSNSVIKTLEDTQKVAEGGAYTYKLTYTGDDGQEKVLYDSRVVGGEKETESLEGLHEATDSLKDFFYLGELGSNDVGTVRLDVSLDGETQGNVYQDTFAQLQMKFAAEPASADSSSTPKTPKQTNVGRLQQTGDEMMPWMYLFAAVGLCGLILLIVALVKTRKRDEEGR